MAPGEGNAPLGAVRRFDIRRQRAGIRRFDRLDLGFEIGRLLKQAGSNFGISG